MNKIKITAVLLAVTMLAGVFSGCSKTSKTSESDFLKACEKLGLDEFDIEDADFPEAEDLEDGLYFVADEDQIEEFADAKGEDIEEFLKEVDVFEFLEIDEIQSFAAAAKCSGLEDLTDIEDIDDIEDIELDGALAIRLTLGDQDCAEDFIDSVKELLSIIDIRTNRLTTQEVYSSKNEGYLRLHFNVADLVPLVLADEDLVEKAEDYLECDLEDLIGDFTGDIGISIEINGADVFILAGGSVNTEAKTFNDFLKAFGISNDPMKLPMNEKIADDVVDLIGGGLRYLAMYASYKPSDDIIYVPNDDDDGDDGDDGDTIVTNKIGISLPTKDLQRWNSDGYLMRDNLESKGYEVDLRFADNEVSTQTSQIQDMINSGCKVLVIAAIDPSSMGEVLKWAKTNNVVVIAYDRLIMDTPCVDYYVSFDDYMVGVMQGTYIINALDLGSAEGPFNLEITAGDPSDPAAALFYNGAMDVLKPYIDGGKLNVASGEIDFDAVATASWNTDRARGRAEYTLGSIYDSEGINVDAWLCSNDSTALGVATALEFSPYEGTYPVITGMDCELANVKNIIAGKQAMSVFKDTRILVDQTVTMVCQIMEGQVVDVNNTTMTGTGMDYTPSYLCTPVFVDINNYKDILIDSGYYTADQLG